MYLLDLDRDRLDRECLDLGDRDLDLRDRERDLRLFRSRDLERDL